MNTEVVPFAPAATTPTATPAQIKAQIQLIQQVMRGVMKDAVHYGKIPGAGERRSLFKPGAEVLCATFRIAPGYRTEDLSDTDCIRYRVTCLGTHQGTGVVLGEGMGEASTNEEKYRWRAAVCEEEYDATAEDRRRLKWKKGQNGAYSIKQVRTEPADIANTVLKMACKRAQVAMTINVTAASDIFTQDLEDMPEEVRQTVADEGGEQSPPRGRPTTQAPQARTGTSGNGGGGRCTDRQAGMLRKKLDASGIPDNEFLQKFAVGAIDELPFSKVDEAINWINSAA